LVLKTNITFVRIDEDGTPIPIGERGKKQIKELIGNNIK
jgi:hypothetical protein